MPLNFHQIIFASIYVIILYFTYNERDRWMNFEAKRLLLIGVLLLLVAIIGNSLVEQKWDIKYILDFLMLKEVGRWFFLMMLGFAYLLVLPSIEILLIRFIRTLKKRKH